MTKQINEAGKELIVDSIRILKGDGLHGAGAATIQRKISQLEQSVTILEGKQEDYWSGIGEDNVITPIEKQTLYKEREIIRNEYVSITKRAESVGITGNLVYQKYDNAYRNLIGMLDDLKVFDDMSQPTEIPNREQFNDNYSIYYEDRDALQDAITKGYVSEGQGSLDRDAVPGMKLSTNVVRVNSDMTVYEPARIDILSVITNGSYEDPYNCIIEICRNGEEKPSVKTGITKLYSYDIPRGTVDLRIVQKNVEGKLVYDNEVIHIYNDRSEHALVVSNSYQTFINGTKTRADASQVDLTAAVKGYYNGYPRSVSNVTVTEAPSLRVTLDDNNVIHMTPEDEVLESGTIGITADIEDPQVIGIGDDLVLGIPELGIVIGQIQTVTMQTEIKYRNYDTLAFLELESEKVENETKSFYIGPIAEPQILQNVEYGQYFLYTGDDTTQFQKGTVYLWNGQRWVNDYNNEHNTVAMKDMFALLGTMPGLANEFINNLVASTAFIKQLFSKYLTLQEGGSIKSENYNAGQSGFFFDSSGLAEFNDVTVRGAISSDNAHMYGDSTFEGDIYSGPLVLSSASSPGADYSFNFRRINVLEQGRAFAPDGYWLLKQYNLIGSKTSEFTSYDRNPGSYTSKKMEGTYPIQFSYLSVSFYSERSFGSSLVYYYSTLYLYDSNMNLLSKYESDTSVSFTISIEGSKTFKLKDLPTYASSEKGVVWTNGTDGILRIS